MNEFARNGWKFDARGVTFVSLGLDMSTTSLKLSDELKQRAVQAAKSQGVFTHALTINAIEDAANAAENRAQFISEARAAREQMLDSGKGFHGDDVHACLKERAAPAGTARTKTSRPKEKNGADNLLARGIAWFGKGYRFFTSEWRPRLGCNRNFEIWPNSAIWPTKPDLMMTW